MKKTILTIAMLLPAGGAHAGTSGAQFLNIDVSARAVGMGSAYTAASDGAGSIGYNPAGLLSGGGVEAALSHTRWLMESSHDFAAAAFPLKGLRAGVGYSRFAAGEMTARDASGAAVGSFSNTDQAVSFNLAGRVKGLGLGAGVKYITSSLGGENASTFAADLGVTAGLGRVTVGLAARNIGPGLKYLEQSDPLPLAVSAGALAHIIPGFGVSADITRLAHEDRTVVSVGSEYALLPALSLRAGYLAGRTTAEDDNRGFSAGAGVNLAGASLDYALTPYGELGSAQRITLRKRF